MAPSYDLPAQATPRKQAMTATNRKAVHGDLAPVSTPVRRDAPAFPSYFTCQDEA